jgi:cytochrome c oxidase subunit 3
MSSATTASPYLAHHFESLEKQGHAARMGMWLFLATEILLFAVLFAAYGVYRYLYYDAFVAASKTVETWVGAVNTGVLVTSSLTVALGVDAAARGNGKRTGLLLLASVALAVVFLALKAYEYHHHFVTGQLPTRYYTYAEIQAPGVGIFWALYFLITGLHAIHVVIGMTILTVVAVMALRGRFAPEYHTPVELGGLYWHLVDLIWIFVFPLIYLI